MHVDVASALSVFAVNVQIKQFAIFQCLWRTEITVEVITWYHILSLTYSGCICRGHKRFWLVDWYDIAHTKIDGVNFSLPHIRWVWWSCVLNCYMLSSLPCFCAFCWSAIPTFLMFFIFLYHIACLLSQAIWYTAYVLYDKIPIEYNFL